MFKIILLLISICGAFASQDNNIKQIIKQEFQQSVLQYIPQNVILGDGSKLIDSYKEIEEAAIDIALGKKEEIFSPPPFLEDGSVNLAYDRLSWSDANWNYYLMVKNYIQYS